MGGDGPEGDEGAAGPPGAPGAAGAAGVAGAAGTIGPMGFDGADGADGDVGPRGPTGATGATGATGVGLLGPPGVDGDPGDDGVPGLPGAPGSTGAAGVMGPMGYALDVDDVEPWFAPGAPGVVDLAARYRCNAFNSAVQAVASGGFVTLTLDSEKTDVGGMHDLVVNNSRVTIPPNGDGRYLLIGKSRIAASASNQNALQILKSATTAVSINTIAPSTLVALDFETITEDDAVAGDFYELQGFQLSGGPVNFGAAVAQAASRLIVIQIPNKIPNQAGATGAGVAGSYSLSAVIVNVGAGRSSGTFDLTGLSGLTPGKAVTVVQTAAAVPSKGNARDELELDAVIATGYVVDAATIRVYWSAIETNSVIVGDVAFGYAVAA